MQNKRGTRALSLIIAEKILPKSKNAQVTIFIIIAVIIIAVALLFYFLSPSIGITTQQAKNPQQFIETCVIEDLENSIEQISLQGGSLNPEGSFTYNNIPIKYLCYTNENYELCNAQQPQLKPSIEAELADSIQETVDSCFNSLQQNYEEDGYTINLKPGVIDVELLPKKIITNLNYEVTLTKESSEKYDEFDIILNNNLYELVDLANYIAEAEKNAGDGSVTCNSFNSNYPEFNCKKNVRDDGTNIYVLTYNNKDKFQFASRSMAPTPGYGL